MRKNQPLVFSQSEFNLTLMLDTPDFKIAAYGFEIHYDPAYLSKNFSSESDIVGKGWFITASAMPVTPGKIRVTEFDVQGKGPGWDLVILKLSFNSKNKLGSSDVKLNVRSLVDPSPKNLRALVTNARVNVKALTVVDINNDSEVNIVDALLIAQYYVGIRIPDSVFYESAAEVNLDGKITIVDALPIAQYYVNILKILPVK